MSDHDWCCPECGRRVHWNEDARYSLRLDDSVCLTCAESEEADSDRPGDMTPCETPDCAPTGAIFDRFFPSE